MKRQFARSLRKTAKELQKQSVRQKSTSNITEWESGRRYSHQTAVKPEVVTAKANDLTTWLSDHISNFSMDDISDKAAHRSKRLMLDTLGVGLIGSKTEIAETFREFAHIAEGFHTHHNSTVWGTKNTKASAPMAAYLNGASCHSMDFDDTWHPATHPSGPVLPAILALSEKLPRSLQPSLDELLIAYNIGIQVQGALLRCSTQAKNIPHRLHPPAIVGVMGSAAATSRLLRYNPQQCRHALAIAASFAGAPMANAGTTTKPLHAGKSARFGLEATILAGQGIEGNANILDMASGFGAYYDDYDPQALLQIISEADNVILHDQDVAIKRFPCHLGMHWAIDAAMRAREELINNCGGFSSSNIKQIDIVAPPSKYINRPIPSTEHEARHSFQFTVGSAILDGEVNPESFQPKMMSRTELLSILNKTKISTPENNKASFADMFVEVSITTNDGHKVQAKCETPYGHWRKPLSDKDVEKKFRKNTSHFDTTKQNSIINLVWDMDKSKTVNELTELLQE